MERITRINKIKGHRIFRDFAWPSTLPDFPAKVLIYGWNGTGKTTLSNLFRCLEKKQNVTEGEISFAVGDQSISEKEILTASFPNVRVFNRAFVDESVFRADGVVSPIYILGEENVEKQRRVEELKRRLEELQPALAQQIQHTSAAHAEVDKISTTTANDIIKPILRSAGSNLYNNYNKTGFERRYQTFVASGEAVTASILSEDNLTIQMRRLNSNEKLAIPAVSFQPPDTDSLSQQVLQLLGATVTSAVIKRLQDDAELSSWVAQGLNLTQARNSRKCLFCEQTLQTETINALEAHFNDAYQSFISSIDTAIHHIDLIYDSMKAVKEGLPDPARFYEHLQDGYRVARDEADAKLTILEDVLHGFKTTLTEKKASPFQALDIELVNCRFTWEGIAEINSIIDQHNRETSAFTQSVSQARQAIEAHHVALRFAEYQAAKERIAQHEVQLQATRQEIERTQAEIVSLEEDITDHRKPAEELNSVLEHSLGHCDLRLETLETGYCIKRGDKPAENLSEGERTTIAFLYFLQTLEDKDFSIQEGIVIIDDPVSSLDSNCLFQTFAFMKERLKDAGQLFILTHSYIFFRQVKNWFHFISRPKANRGTVAFYQLQNMVNNLGRCSELTTMCSLLRENESEYQYIFKYVYDASNASSAGMESFFQAPNAARRLLEAFISFKLPATKGELYNKLQSIDFDEVKKTRICRLLNTGSHYGYVADGEDDFAIASEIPDVLGDVLELIKTLDSTHYEEMMSLVAPPLSTALPVS
jgi:wobble nucleotide-excising tRNase